MITKKEVERITQVIDKITCNMCGKETITDCSPQGNGIHIHFRNGYDSELFGDQTEVKFDLCEECVFKITSMLKIKAEISHYQIGEQMYCDCIRGE